MIVVDASWIIALRDPADQHHAAAVALNTATAHDVVLVHPLTLAECLVGPAKMGVIDSAAAAARAAFQVTDVDPDAPERWASLRASTGLRLPDAIVLDTAVHYGATAILTFDAQLALTAVERGVEAP